jgi:hypothetical protein
MLGLIVLSTLAFARSAASSVATDEAGRHGAELALDGLLSTGWAEGAPGTGDGAWWEFDLASPTTITTLSLWPGNLKDGARSFREYGRPKTVRILVDGKPVGEPVRLQDTMRRADLDVGVTGRTVRIELVESFEGGVYGDTYLSEVAVNFDEGERARSVARLDAWRASREAQQLQARHEADVIKAFDTHTKQPEDAKSLAFLVDAAGEGAPYLRRRVAGLVPEGFRAAAIVADPKAHEALRKLKDANGIPGLEQAALRALGREQAAAWSDVEYFYAWAELQGGGRKNVLPWGESGWEPGALRSFGEPLAIERDRAGRVWVGDLANNRVQRFGDDGVVQAQWGGPRDVTEAWFAGRRPWYAAGSVGAEATGSFVNVLDVELMPAKDGDSFAVLDGVGRVQLFGPDGALLRGWTADVGDSPEPGVGGQGYLAWLPKKKELVVVLGSRAARYDMQGERLGEPWKLADGAPGALDVAPDGRIWTFHGQAMLTWSADGFRYGVEFGTDVLGAGFESADVTFDEEGRMWVLTDGGWLHCFKKPGKVDWKLRVSEVELVHPRVAVAGGVVWFTDRDRIVRVDALQKHAAEVQAAQEAAAKGGAAK